MSTPPRPQNRPSFRSQSQEMDANAQQESSKPVPEPVTASDSAQTAQVIPPRPARRPTGQQAPPRPIRRPTRDSAASSSESLPLRSASPEKSHVDPQIQSEASVTPNPQNHGNQGINEEPRSVPSQPLAKTDADTANRGSSTSSVPPPPRPSKRPLKSHDEPHPVLVEQPARPQLPAHRPSRSKKSESTEDLSLPKSESQPESNHSEPENQRFWIQPADPYPRPSVEETKLKDELEALDTPDAAKNPETVKLFKSVAENIDSEGPYGNTSKLLGYPTLGPQKSADSFDFDVVSTSRAHENAMESTNESTQSRLERRRQDLQNLKDSFEKQHQHNESAHEGVKKEVRTEVNLHESAAHGYDNEESEEPAESAESAEKPSLSKLELKMQQLRKLKESYEHYDDDVASSTESTLASNSESVGKDLLVKAVSSTKSPAEKELHHVQEPVQESHYENEPIESDIPGPEIGIEPETNTEPEIEPVKPVSTDPIVTKEFQSNPASVPTELSSKTDLEEVINDKDDQDSNAEGSTEYGSKSVDSPGGKLVCETEFASVVPASEDKVKNEVSDTNNMKPKEKSSEEAMAETIKSIKARIQEHLKDRVQSQSEDSSPKETKIVNIQNDEEPKKPEDAETPKNLKKSDDTCKNSVESRKSIDSLEAADSEERKPQLKKNDLNNDVKQDLESGVGKDVTFKRSSVSENGNEAEKDELTNTSNLSIDPSSKPPRPLNRPDGPKPSIKPRGAFVSRFEEALRAHEEPKPKPMPRPKPKAVNSDFSGRLATLQDLSSVLSRGLTPGAQRPKPKDLETSSDAAQDTKTDASETESTSDGKGSSARASNANETADAQLKAMPALKKKTAGPSRRKRLPESVKPRFKIVVPTIPLWELRFEPEKVETVPASTLESAACSPRMVPMKHFKDSEPSAFGLMDSEPDVQSVAENADGTPEGAKLTDLAKPPRLFQPHHVKPPPMSPGIENPDSQTSFFSNMPVESAPEGSVSESDRGAFDVRSTDSDIGLEFVSRPRVRGNLDSARDERIPRTRPKPLSRHMSKIGIANSTNIVSSDVDEDVYVSDPEENSSEFASRPMGRGTELNLRDLLHRALLQNSVDTDEASASDQIDNLDLPPVSILIDQNPSPSANTTDDPFNAIEFKPTGMMSNDMDIPLSKLVDKLEDE